MNKYWNIIRYEWLLLRRDRAFAILFGFVLVLSLYTIFVGYKKYQYVKQQREQAASKQRKLFLNQGEVNAHMAAHYGYIVVKPSSLLSFVDPGVEPYTGTTIRLEAHQQNDPVFVPASGQSSLIRFGELSFGLLLQVIFPLLIIFSSYRSVINDRENGTLKLLLSQGVSLRTLILGKVLTYTMIYLFFLIISVLIYALVVKMEIGTYAWDQILYRLLFMILIYFLYYFIIASITVFLSAVYNSSSALLVTLLALWFVFSIIMPKATANFGAQYAPLQSKQSFNKSMVEASKTGIDKLPPIEEYKQHFRDSLMNAYHVTDLKDLPFRSSGVLMQADETYRNVIYDHAFGGYKDTIRLQNSIATFSSLLNPFQAIKNLSMAICASDVEHHFLFLEQGEKYRRKLVAELNHQDAYGEHEDVSKDYFHRIPDFSYQSPSIAWSIARRKLELTSIGLWSVILLVLLISGTLFIKKI